MKIGNRFTRFIKIVSIATAFILIAAIFYSIKSRMGLKREIKEGEDPYLISNLFDKSWRNNSFWNDSTEKIYFQCSYNGIKDSADFFLESNVSSVLYNQEFKVKTSDPERLDLVEVFQNQLISSRSFSGNEGSFMGVIAISKKNVLDVFNYKQSAQSYDGLLFRGFEKNKKGGFHFYYNSYLDKEAIGEREMENNFIFEDQLLFVLRSLKFNDVEHFNADVMESQMQSKLGRMHIYSADFKVLKNDVNNTFMVEVDLDKDKKSTYEFDANFPNRLVQAKLWNGLNLKVDGIILNKKSI